MSYYNPSEIASIFADASKAKAQTPFIKFALMAIMGGIFIALGGLLTVIVAGGMPDVATHNIGLVKFTAGALFPVGLIMVSIAGADLFTSDCAGMVLSTMQQKTTIKQLIRVWILAYLFNFIGAQLVAYFMAHKTGIITPAPYADYLTLLASSKLKYPFATVFLKGIGANALVCLGTWMGYAGKDVVGKALGIWVPVMLFVTLGYEHSIANMFFIPAAIYNGADISWCQFVFDNLIPATIGNIVGGAIFIGMIFGYIYNKK
ncbi:MAG: formate/nitrite transporter family protein [Alphaproteobacteria bacterium]|nr:formate/nitrite transporter family protein [Alphaproteobacteria bacterium]